MNSESAADLITRIPTMTLSELDRALEEVLARIASAHFRRPMPPIWSLKRLAGTLDRKPGGETEVDFERGYLVPDLEAIYLAAYNRAVTLWGEDPSLPEPPVAEREARVGLQQIRLWYAKTLLPGDGMQRREPLSKRAGRIYEKLRSLQEHQAMTLPEIQEWYASETNKELDEGTWKRIRRELEPYGLQNRANVGYYIRKTDHPETSEGKAGTE